MGAGQAQGCRGGSAPILAPGPVPWGPRALSFAAIRLLWPRSWRHLVLRL